MPQSPTSGAVVARETGGRQLVVLRLGDREYGLATEVVVQVLRMVAVRPVPESGACSRVLRDNLPAAQAVSRGGP